ncbi:zinc finger BED domain-containing protein 1-like [Pecten maximus]|uniref:zinc finger BED domain-containing protein 1-like n=1 Tax=Pecten maximus TaxID=6579 RepID=UPI0014587C9A|nr:zinc finger BED domain-containing protein 1-like [Pecten maximus]
MTAHVSRKHGITLKPREPTARTTRSGSCQSSPRSENGQLRINEAFTSKNKFSHSSTRHGEITKSIGVFIAKDMRPFSVLENQGFVNMINVLEPRYDMPGRTHFSTNVIPKLYEETKETVTKCLKEADFVALTTDAWTSRATQSYNTITAHFILNWEIQSVVLRTRVMHESHIAQHLAELLTAAVAEWNLKRHDQMPSLTTDNAKNILNAGELAGFHPHIGCVAHAINLATQGS